MKDINPIEMVCVMPRFPIRLFKSFLYFLCLGASSYQYATEGVAYHTITAQTDEERLDKEGHAVLERSQRVAKLYDLKEGEDLKDITEIILGSPDTSDLAKNDILAYDRRIFVFTYPSDGLQIKGFVSYTPNSEGQPLLMLLRGGNNVFGLFSPGIDLGTYKDYTVVSTTYRGGVSEGVDEFGGADVRDVKHLFDYLPILQQKLHKHFNPRKVFMLGCSRGGMEMFLALARFPEIQHHVDKIVALSSTLDLRLQLKKRPDMKEMFIQEFGLIEGVNEEEWINSRDPILTIPHIRKDLPILILQGGDDIRIDLEEGHHMVSKLEESCHHVTYWEIEKGHHCLFDLRDRMEMIASWLELEEEPGLNCKLLKPHFWGKSLRKDQPKP